MLHTHPTQEKHHTMQTEMQTNTQAMPAALAQAAVNRKTLVPELTAHDLMQVGYFTRPVEDGALLADLTNPDPTMKHRIVIIRGAPGVGKSEMAKAIARAIFAKTNAVSYIEYLTHSWTSNEQLFVGPNVQNIAVGVNQPEHAIIKGVLWRAAEKSCTMPVVLLLDEFDKCQQRSEALLLGFLQDGRVQDSDPQDAGGEIYACLENIVLVITSNDTRDLYEATLRRAFRYEMPFLPEATEVQLLRKWTGAPVAAIQAVVTAARTIRQRGSSVSAQEMAYLLTGSRRMETVEQLGFLIKGRLMKQPGDLTPNELANLSVTLYNESALPARIRSEGGK